MSKVAIVIFSALSIATGVVGLIISLALYTTGNQAADSGNAYLPGCLESMGALLAFIAWIGAIRNAWWCKAYGWLVAVIFTGQFGALAYGLLGPGRLAKRAEERLKWLLRIGPRGSGVPTAMSSATWTVQLLKTALNFYAGVEHYDLVEEDSTLIRTIRRFGWHVFDDGSCQKA